MSECFAKPDQFCIWESFVRLQASLQLLDFLIFFENRLIELLDSVLIMLMHGQHILGMEVVASPIIKPLFEGRINPTSNQQTKTSEERKFHGIANFQKPSLQVDVRHGTS